MENVSYIHSTASPFSLFDTSKKYSILNDVHESLSQTITFDINFLPENHPKQRTFCYYGIAVNRIIVSCNLNIVPV